MNPILILGDCYFKGFENKKPSLDEIMSIDILNTLRRSSFCLLNLESPLTNSEKPIPKDGPNLKSSPFSAETIKEMNISLVGLANNHINDFGTNGILDTISAIEKEGLNWFGLCSCKDYSHNCFIHSAGNTKIGFYAVCENEFSGYYPETLGANIIERPRCLNEIAHLASECDYTVVLFHGGKELYRYPTPLQQRICKEFVDFGADLVVCQHSHCIGCLEQYKDSTILYGQGNFYFGSSGLEEYKEGLLIELSFDDRGGKPKLNFLPIIAKGSTIVLANESERKHILSSMESRKQELAEKGADAIYYDRILSKNTDFLYLFFNKGKWFSRFDRYIMKGRLIRRMAKKHKKRILLFLNYLRCETHHEFLMKILDYYSNLF